jgi:hypothetical protein
MSDALIMKFKDTLASQNEESASTVGSYLQDFEAFVSSELKMTVSRLIANLKAGNIIIQPSEDVPTSKEEQPYFVMAQYAKYLKRVRFDTGKNGARTMRLKISWARTLLESNFIPISKVIFKLQVKSPKPEDPELSPVDRNQVCQVIAACDDIRLATFCMWMAAMGWRPLESLTVQNQNFEDLDLKTLKFEDNPTFVNVRGKSAKTKKGKRRQLTAELRSQIERYLAWKYRPRVISHLDRSTDKWMKKSITPLAKPTDYVFAPYHDVKAEPGRKFFKNTYSQVADRFALLMDRLEIGREESGKRHAMTLHSFRRFCYTTCTRAVDEQYAKYHVGRRVHEYDKRTDDQKIEDFAKVEPYLTFLDTSGLESMGKDIQAKLREKDDYYKRMMDEIRAEFRAEIDALKRGYETREIIDKEDIPQSSLPIQRRK